MLCIDLPHHCVGLFPLPHSVDSSRTHIRSTPLTFLCMPLLQVTLHQVLYSEFRAARANCGGNGGALIASIALLAIAAVMSAADASGIACR